ncbi:MAG: calcium/sodium antiporter [Azospirillaceae bacterium]
MIVDLAMVAGGFLLLMGGADYLVRGAVGLARRIGVSTLVIGLTVVALGTSLPELVVSLRAAIGGNTGLTVGNIVGSNIANILLILGVAAVIWPVACARTTLFRDGSAMVAATALFVVVGLAGGYGRIYGFVGLGLLVAYMGWCYHHDRRDGGLAAREAEEVEPIQGSAVLLWLAILGGLVAVVAGGELLVHGAVGIARTLGVSEEVIGLTLVAFGTSVPELATTVVAAMRRHADVALGNVLGSNLFNLLGVLGVTAIVVPLPLPDKIAAFDLWVMAGVSILLVPLMRSGWRLGRLEGGIFVMIYIAFVAAQFFGVGEYMTALAAR